MAKSFDQINFDFSGDEAPKEFLSGRPVPQPVPEPKSGRGRKPLKDSEADVDNVAVPDDDVLFQKQYYTIGEVAQMFGVNTSQIRFWENEFDILEPKKNKKGDRYFRPADVKNLLLIHDLLRRRKFTLDGAKDYLKSGQKAAEKFALIQSLQKVKGFLQEIKAHL